jgi:hypothetical protein
MARGEGLDLEDGFLDLGGDVADLSAPTFALHFQ